MEETIGKYRVLTRYYKLSLRVPQCQCSMRYPMTLFPQDWIELFVYGLETKVSGLCQGSLTWNYTLSRASSRKLQVGRASESLLKFTV